MAGGRLHQCSFTGSIHRAVNPLVRCDVATVKVGCRIPAAASDGYGLGAERAIGSDSLSVGARQAIHYVLRDKPTHRFDSSER